MLVGSESLLMLPHFSAMLCLWTMQRSVASCSMRIAKAMSNVLFWRRVRWIFGSKYCRKCLKRMKRKREPTELVGFFCLTPNPSPKERGFYFSELSIASRRGKGGISKRSLACSMIKLVCVNMPFCPPFAMRSL